MMDLDDPTVEPATAVASAEGHPALRVVFSGERVWLHDRPLGARGLTLGRGDPASSTASELRLDTDPRLSRRHATFSIVNGRVRLQNESDKGSFQNGARIDDSAELEEGDVVRLGDTFLVVRSMPDTAATTKKQSAPLPTLPGASRTLLGRAPSVEQLRALIDIVGPTRASVVLLGETGAGKDVAARALHERSGRRGPFVPVNCAAIPENLAESQLFGHRAGSFTGANEERAGLFRDAHNGTLFLDEVGELPLSLQAKLLRVLDERAVYAVGASAGVPVDVRVIVATNREIAQEVERRAFRADLFARLAEITISLPPLRARKEDVLVLLESALPGLKDGTLRLAPQLVNALLNHAWPFNVRELMKIATELEVKAQGRPVLDVDLLAGRVLGPVPAPSSTTAVPRDAPAGPTSVNGRRPAEKAENVPAPEREELERLLALSGGKVSEVAKATGRSRTQVYRWLEQMGLDITAYRKG